MIPKHLFKDSVSVKRAARVSDGQGGHTETYSTTATIKGRFSQLSGKDIEIAGQDRAHVTYAFFCNPDADIEKSDELEWNSRTFRVLVPDMTPSKAVYKKVLVEEVQNG